MITVQENLYLSKPVLVIGGGGHASVLVEILKENNTPILGLVCPEKISDKPVFSGIKHIKFDDHILDYPAREIDLVNAIGVLPGELNRKKIFQKYLDIGYKFATVISKQAIVSNFCRFAEGVQIMPGAVVNSGVIVGENSIINTSATIEHDCIVGQHCHVAPGAVLCGSVKLGADTFVGANATLIQSIEIGERATIGAGSLVRRDVASDSKLYGIQ